METGRAEEAIPLLAEAETQYAQAESTRWLIEAQVLKAQATWLAREEERPAAVALLRELMSKVPEGQQPALAEWLEKH
jgi:hypothetical protein